MTHFQPLSPKFVQGPSLFQLRCLRHLLLVCLLLICGALLSGVHAQSEGTPADTDTADVMPITDATVATPVLTLDNLGSTLLTDETDLTITGEVTPGASLSINDLPVAVADSGAFTASFDLAEGVYQLVFDVRVPNILLRRTVTVRIDTSPPSLRVNTPATLLTTEAVMLSGTVELDSTLQIMRDGSVVTRYNAESASAFNLELDLDEGLNIFEAIASDEAGNRTTSRFAVVRDSRLPALELADLPAATQFNTVQLRGSSDPGSSVRVTTAQGVITADVYSNGSFDAGLPLVDGENSLLVQAVDSAGNVREQTLSVIQDTLAPQLSVTTSEADAITQATTVTLTGEVDDNHTDAPSVLVNGERVTLEQGSFTYTADLTEGWNGFSISAEDAAGNVAQRELTLVRDSTPPSLEIDSPSDVTTADTRILVYTEEAARVSLDGTSMTVLPGGIVVAEVALTPGENSFVITAQDAIGNLDERTVTVTYTP
ncbi:MAG: Ig-like domain-containing protein [Deinococcota bacterium]